MREVSYSTTVYFNVPDEYTPEEYIKWLERFLKLDMLSFATDVGEGSFEVMDDI